MKENIGTWKEAVKAKRKWLICAAVVLAVVIVILILTPLLVEWRATVAKSEEAGQKILEKCDGRYYVYIPEGEEYYEFYAFKNGEFATERVSPTDGREGDISVFSPYEVKVSLEDDYISIVQNERCVVSFYLTADTVCFAEESVYPATPENIENMSQSMLCEHDWEETVVYVATCTREGKTKKECKNCGESEIIVTDATHNYVNGRCNRCGKYRESEKESSDESSNGGEKTTLSGNTWYTYNSIPSLQVQNIAVKNATMIGQGRGVVVNGYHFCARCGTLDDWLSMDGVEFGYDTNELYVCDNCNYTTTVRLRLR